MNRKHKLAVRRAGLVIGAGAVTTAATGAAIGFYNTFKPSSNQINIIIDPATKAYDVKFGDDKFTSGEVVGSINVATIVDDKEVVTNSYSISGNKGEQSLSSSFLPLKLSNGAEARVKSDGNESNPIIISMPDGKKISVCPSQRLINPEPAVSYYNTSALRP